MDAGAQEHILELRPTVIPSKDQRRPILTVEEIRTRVLRVAAAGGKVGILGSGWEALDLAVVTSNESESARPSMFFGSANPLYNALPKYLSSAVKRRLKSKGINVHDRTVVRYISSHERQQDNGSSRLQLHTAKSYDLLDSSQADLDLLVVAPNTSGTCGSAALPTEEVPSHLQDSANGRSWYQTWANLSIDSANDASLVICYKDDGRVAVNTELCACSGVYAAGSVAKVANGLTGHADVAGYGFEDGAAAGRVAGLNMARHYHTANNSHSSIFRFGFNKDLASEVVMTKDPLPVWRSDLRSVCHNHAQKSSLAQIGIQALCVGNCDSENLLTHGVWWTNRSAQKRLYRLLQENDSNPTEEEKEGSHTSRLTTRRRQRGKKEPQKPIYGIGIIYYLDRRHKIQGIMTWGVPFTNGITDTLNVHLVRHMKAIITTNGGFHNVESQSDRTRMSNSLVQKSQHMVSMAFSAFLPWNKETDRYQIHGTILEDIPRPLHRFTEVTPPNVRSLNILKRKDGHGHGILGQDLFDRYEGALVENPIPTPHPSNVGYAVDRAQRRYEWNVWEQKFKIWNENESRARPAKEEPLWIRKGDELRLVSAHETLMTAYKNAIW